MNTSGRIPSSHNTSRNAMAKRTPKPQKRKDPAEGSEKSLMKSAVLESSPETVQGEILSPKGKKMEARKKRKRQKERTESRWRSVLSPLSRRRHFLPGTSHPKRWGKKLWGRCYSCWSSPPIRWTSLLSRGEPQEPPITQRERELAGKISRIPLPSFVHRAIFDCTSALQDFFSLRLFLLIVVTGMLLLGYSCGIFSRIPQQWKTVVDAFSNVFVAINTEETERPGLQFYEKFNSGAAVLPHRHPVLILPGFITTGLEVWEANSSCLQKLDVYLALRQWMLGPKMLLLMIRDPACWFELFSLDPNTGMDKNGTRVRGGEGAASVGEFVPGFWVWEKIIRNLADIGYDPSSLAVATYDWRLSPDLLQARDGFFYRMKHLILQLYEQHHGQRIVIIGHSYANTVLTEFLLWAEGQEAGFLNTYVSDIINIGGLTLGAFKALSATLFGDVRDTLDIPRVLRRVLDQVVDVGLRTNLSRTWSSLLSMLPHPCLTYDRGFLQGGEGLESSTEEALEKLLVDCQRTGHKICEDKVKQRLQKGSSTLPHLPYAPNTTMYCLYGVHKPTEVGYHVRRAEEDQVEQEPEAGHFRRAHMERVVAHDSMPNGGVVLAEGDGTVPLPSLAYMCRAPNGWKKSLRRVVTMEFAHNTSQATLLDFRGGRSSGDHVDILGNHEALEVILRIVSGVEEEIESNHQVGVPVPSKEDGKDKKKNAENRKNSTNDYPSLWEDRIFSNVDELLASRIVEQCKTL